MNEQGPNVDGEAFTLTLRQAAMREADVNIRYALKGAADLIDDAIDDVVEFRNDAAMIELNGAWAYAVRVYNLHREPKQPQPPVSQENDALPMRNAA